jgi:carbon storage regulator
VLVLTRKPEQSLRLGDNITVTVLAIEGDRVKLGIEAPRAVSVLRQELFMQIQAANAAAASAGQTSPSNVAAVLRRRSASSAAIPTP